MMDVYIYLLAPSGVIVTIHVTQGQAMPNFCSECKVTCHQIFVVEIWYRARMPRESIDWDHAHTCKALKANAKIMFLLPISKN